MTFAERFLRHPERFPAASEGEPWGDGQALVEIAGGPYRITGLGTAQLGEIERRLGERVRRPPAGGHGSATGVTTTAVRVLRLEEAAFRTFDRRGWEMTVDRDPRPGSVRLAGWRFLGAIRWRPTLEATLWTPVGAGPELHGVFENFLRVLVAYRLLGLGGVAIHSAGIRDDLAATGGDSTGEPPGARLFLGPSGAGKTTLSGRAAEAGATVLSDDLNAVVPGPVPPGSAAEPGGRFRVERLPFAGDLGQTAAPGGRSPLLGLHRLAQGREVRWEPLSRARALAALVTCCPFVNTDPHRQGELERVLMDLLAAVPTGTLTVPRDVPFARVVEVLSRAEGRGSGGVEDRAGSRAERPEGELHHG